MPGIIEHMGLWKSILPFIVFLEDESSVLNYLVAADILESGLIDNKLTGFQKFENGISYLKETWPRVEDRNLRSTKN